MRKLSNDEKEFTKKLVKLSESTQNVFFSNIVDDEMRGINVHVDYKNKKVHWRFDARMYDKNLVEFLCLQDIFLER